MTGASAHTDEAFYARPVATVARDLVGATLRHGATAGRIVETEAYHESEPACHAYVGHTARTSVLFGAPMQAYVYRSYGIHALFNAVCEDHGVGAAVLIRALEPIEGLSSMRRRRGRQNARDLCSGPGKLTQALGIDLDLNDSQIGDAIEISPRPPDVDVKIAVGTRIGISKGIEIPWRFCDAASAGVSRPLPPPMRRGRRSGLERR